MNNLQVKLLEVFKNELKSKTVLPIYFYCLKEFQGIFHRKIAYNLRLLEKKGLVGEAYGCNSKQTFSLGFYLL